jgi:hypothetical protein
MRYLLTIYADESARADVSPEEAQAQMAVWQSFTEDAQEKGVFVGGEGLQPTSTATTVRVRDGERMVTDGPFAETKEQLGGFYLLDCEDLDAAIDWAARIPAAPYGSIEVRPVMVFEEDPSGTPDTASSQA